MYCTVIQYSTIQYSTVQYSTVQYSTVQYKISVDGGKVFMSLFNPALGEN